MSPSDCLKSIAEALDRAGFLGNRLMIKQQPSCLVAGGGVAPFDFSFDLAPEALTAPPICHEPNLAGANATESKPSRVADMSMKLPPGASKWVGNASSAPIATRRIAAVAGRQARLPPNCGRSRAPSDFLTCPRYADGSRRTERAGPSRSRHVGVSQEAAAPRAAS